MENEKDGLVQPKPGDRVVEIARRSDGYVEYRTVVTGKSDRQIDRLVNGMSINLDHVNWSVVERDIPADVA